MRIRHTVVATASACAAVTATLTLTSAPASSSTLQSQPTALPALPSTQPTPTVMSVGEYDWLSLGGNTGTGAKAFSDQLGAGGYATSPFANGRPIADVFDAMPTYAVTFLYGHGAPGEMETDAELDYTTTSLMASIPTDSTWEAAPPPKIREIDDYLPASEFDDALLVIYAACHTAQTSAVWGNLVDVSVSKGVDTVVGMRGEPLLPSANSTTPMSYGNYFWNRAGYYLRSGNTVAQSLNKATQDQITKEGSASGWDNYVIDGAASSPASTKVVPPRSGSTLVPGIGIVPARPAALTPSTSVTTSVDGVDVVDAVTADGLSYRTDARTGKLLALSGEAQPSGPVTMTEDDAVAAAQTFASEQLGPGARLTSVEHRDGGVLRDSVATTVTIQARDAQNIPNLLVIEVDRRSGRITNYVRGQAGAPAVATTEVSASQAVSTARELVGSGARVLSVELRQWNDPEWVVLLEVPAAGDSVATKRELLVSASTRSVTMQAVGDTGDRGTPAP